MDFWIWNKGLPFKTNFFLQRAWKGRIATYDNLKRVKVHIVSSCWCCGTQQMETLSHIFLSSPISQKLWRFFANTVGISVEDRNLMQNYMNWWCANKNSGLQYTLNTTPASIILTLWKRRNKIKHEDMINFESLTHQVHNLCVYLLRMNILI